jgi:serine/threonine-protein phosphatase PGAM5
MESRDILFAFAMVNMMNRPRYDSTSLVSISIYIIGIYIYLYIFIHASQRCWRWAICYILSNQCTSLSRKNKTQEDEKRKLTPLGARQAELTGQRLAEILKGVLEEEGRGRPCSVSLRVSCLTRARETADIIATFLPRLVTVVEACDERLNEGRPCHHIPCSTVSERVVQATDDSHPRIEQAFQNYFYRVDYNKQADAADRTEMTKKTWNPPIDFEDDSIVAAVGDTADVDPPRHEFEIIVCHANVIRYFLCRALQLPPEAWLRFCPFNCSLTYLTIRPTGTVSCRLLGDIGHLPYSASTFSSHHGFNW